MKTPSVSIIMPIYNASRYLHQSLGGLLHQTLNDIEIICVNDGSKDSSLDIIQQYASQDHRIKVIDKPNGGYGHSMNRGLAMAKGQYIGILEPDDFVDANMFETLYRLAIENNCDVVKSNYYEYREKDDSNTFFEVLQGFDYDKVISSNDNVRLIYMRPCIWSAIYRRDFLNNHQICFNETPGASYQDTSFAFKVWVCAQRVLFTKEGFLHYRIDNENSSVNSSGKIFCICDEFQSIQSFLNLDNEKKSRFIKLMQVLKFDSYYWNLQRISDEHKREFRDQMALEFIKADYEGFLEQDLFDEWRWDTLQDILNSYRQSSVEERGIIEQEVRVYADSYSYKIGYALLQPVRIVAKIFHFITPKKSK